jgi:hypothetical protein
VTRSPPRADNRRMSRRLTRFLPSLAPLGLALLATGCATSATVVPGRTLALTSIEYPDGAKAVAVQAGEASPATRFAEAFLRELGREKQYQVVDARNRGVRYADLGKSSAKTEALHRDVPADAYLSVRLLGCSAAPTTERERRGSGTSAIEVTVYFFRGECSPEVTAFDAAGKTIATLQRTGRWDSPRQDRPDTAAMQSQALSSAIDDAARRLAREIRPAPAGTK